MIKINKYIEVVEQKGIIECGKYKVGKDIPCGEYYLWGNDIWYSYVRKKEKSSYEYEREAYDIFEKGDLLTLEAGRMTLTDNLRYLTDPKAVILPGHIYRVGNEIPQGYYLFRYDEKYFRNSYEFPENRDECVFNLHENYANSRYHRESGRCGCVLLNSHIRHMTIENGTAIYYGDEKFDEVRIVWDCKVEANIFFSKGVRIFKNEIIEISIYAKYDKKSRFYGATPVDVVRYEIYTMGDELKWQAIIQPLSFQRPHTMTIRVTDMFNKNTTYITKINKFGNFRNKDNAGDFYYFSAVLSRNLIGKQLNFELLEYNGKNVTEPLGENFDIYKYGRNREEFLKLKQLLEKFEGLDIEYEVKYLEKAPDLVKEINECLEKIVDKRDAIQNINGEVEQKIIFYVPVTYDKKFYCCAKLADDAWRVEANERHTEYKVVFRGSQINEIEIMSYLLYGIYNRNEVPNKDYLRNNSYIFYAKDGIQQKIDSLNEKYGYSSIVTNSVLVRIIKILNKKLQQRVDKLYSEISREGRIRTKWGNEYHLFLLISKYVHNATYQYHCEWLGKQSYDIYLEQYRTAIEYQGKQHYEAVELFGGDEGLQDNKERDKRKKMLSEEHGIKLLEWKYTVPVNEKNVIKFLLDNGIQIEKNGKKNCSDNDDRIMMAPVVKNEKRKRIKTKIESVKENKTYIVSYTTEGELKDRYDTICDAAKSVGISSTSISKVLRGERNTAGGLVWRKFLAGENIPNRIEISFNAGLTNLGQARRVAKLDMSGRVIQEYESIMEASKTNNIEYKRIQRKIKKNQGWRYL